jgi:hypothetical protein
MTPPDTETSQHAPAKKAGLLQVASTMFWGLFMIGKKGTWERDGATMTLRQAIVGGVVTFVVVVLVLVLLVRLALR